MKHPNGNPHHDRLDMKLHTKNYTAPECGSIDLSTGKPTFCDFECPVLHGQQPMPEPHWTADPSKVVKREEELVRLGLQSAANQGHSEVPV
jgi:hypothetical protein